MQNHYLITVEIKDEKSRTGIQRNMDLFFKKRWIQPFDSMFIVQSKYSTVQIANILKHIMDIDDSIFVIKIEKENWVIRSADVEKTQLVNDF